MTTTVAQAPDIQPLPPRGRGRRTTDGAPLDGDRLWTVGEVAEHIRVSTMTVYRLVKAGELPAVRVGRSYRIRASALGAYLDARATTPHPAERS